MVGDATRGDEGARIRAALAEPFAPEKVTWLARQVKGDRALAVPVVAAVVVLDRLDEVLGIAGWQSDYEVLAGGVVVCRLRLRLGGEWIGKAGVSEQAELPDQENRLAGVADDAFKRAAVMFGVGRYLAGVPRVWVEYDPHSNQFVRTPALPAFALPTTPPAARPQPARQP